MVLSPLLKFAIIALGAVVSLISWIWVGIQTDALALGMNVHVYNIVTIVIAGVVQLSILLLGYLGLKAPTVGGKNDPEEPEV